MRFDEIVRASGTESKTKTMLLLNKIIKKTNTSFEAIEIVILPDGSYVFQLKPEYNSTAKRFASKPMIPNATLKTLSYIALKQPVSSKQLTEVRGTGVYAHLKELRQLDFVDSQKVGRLRIYSTSAKFQKYFGIPGDIDDLKAKLFSKVKKTKVTSVDIPPPATNVATK